MSNGDTETASPSSHTVSYPRLPPRQFAAMNPEEYIAERLNESLVWYDKSAKRNKSWYLRMRAVTVISGALVPVLINLDLPYVNLGATVLSLIVVLFVSLESVYHFREQWTNYRSTEQRLRNEYFLFTANEGPYAKMDAHDAFRVFVERVEGTIEAENASTLQVMTTISEIKT